MSSIFPSLLHSLMVPARNNFILKARTGTSRRTRSSMTHNKQWLTHEQHLAPKKHTLLIHSMLVCRPQQKHCVPRQCITVQGHTIFPTKPFPEEVTTPMTLNLFDPLRVSLRMVIWNCNSRELVVHGKKISSGMHSLNLITPQVGL